MTPAFLAAQTRDNRNNICLSLKHWEIPGNAIEFTALPAYSVNPALPDTAPDNTPLPGVSAGTPEGKLERTARYCLPPMERISPRGTAVVGVRSRGMPRSSAARKGQPHRRVLPRHVGGFPSPAIEQLLQLSQPWRVLPPIDPARCPVSASVSVGPPHHHPQPRIVRRRGFEGHGRPVRIFGIEVRAVWVVPGWRYPADRAGEV